MRKTKKKKKTKSVTKKEKKTQNDEKKERKKNGDMMEIYIWKIDFLENKLLVSYIILYYIIYIYLYI